MKTQDKKNSKREDVPTDSKEIQKNVEGQGQQDDAQYDQDEFLDNNLDYKRGDVDEVGHTKTEDDTELIRKWQEIRHYFMMNNSELSEIDVTHGENPGDFDQMLERIGKKSGKSKEQLRKDIQEWDKKNNFKS
ncbi:MAG: hypothetical protein H0X63_09495 [Flavobacteriales bacterium]|jgi:hypothetical protein|nr:hypothetical protein [Flavobacteriales bacterium]